MCLISYDSKIKLEDYEIMYITFSFCRRFMREYGKAWENTGGKNTKTQGNPTCFCLINEFDLIQIIIKLLRSVI